MLIVSALSGALSQEFYSPRHMYIDLIYIYIYIYREREYILYIYTFFFVLHLKLTYTEQKYKRNTFVFAPIFHEMNSKI